jgi:hypothetical protein
MLPRTGHGGDHASLVPRVVAAGEQFQTQDGFGSESWQRRQRLNKPNDA